MDGRDTARRPVAARNTGWASAAARRLAGLGLRPNQVSVLSAVFAALAGLSLVVAGRADIGAGWASTLFIVAGVCIELRLLCNLFDGMLAIEGGLRTSTGVIFNEVPDRVSDVVLLVCAGYAPAAPAWAAALGWAAALLAVGTAYVRLFGGSLGLAQDFRGPMAKQQRMQLLVAACALEAIAAPAGLIEPRGRILMAALAIIIAGCVVTAVRRTLGIARELESR